MSNLTNQGEALALANFLNQTAPEDWSLRLFVNNRIPTESDTLANMVECAAAGYEALTLDGDDWTITEGTAVYAVQQFSLTEAETVYDDYLAQGSTLMLIKRFDDGPYSVPSYGGNILVVPTIQID